VLGVHLGFAAVVAIVGVVIVKEKVEAKGQFVTLLKPPRDHAHMLETFFVQVLNEETKDALMVRPDIKQTISIGMIGLEFVHYFLCQRI
jgi:hypothetical protein